MTPPEPLGLTAARPRAARARADAVVVVDAYCPMVGTLDAYRG
jgi:hypothetical protein